MITQNDPDSDNNPNPIEFEPSPQPEPAEIPIPVNDSPTHAAFVAAMIERAHEVLDPVCPAETHGTLVPDFARALAEENDRILAKFAAGQLKHGGDIRDRDLRQEMQFEIQDLLVYSIAERLQRQFIKFHF